MLTMIGLVFCLLLGVVGFFALGYALAASATEYVETRRKMRRIKEKHEEMRRLRKIYWED